MPEAPSQPINVRITPIWHDMRKSQNHLLDGVLQDAPVTIRFTGRGVFGSIPLGDITESAPEPERRTKDGDQLSIEGTLLGIEQSETGTYSSVVRADGNVFGRGPRRHYGQGGELATWMGQGVGTIKKEGAVSYRGAVYYQSASPAWVRLNSVAAIFEYTRAQLWEWK
jgi:hypothetical protein